MWRLSYAYRGFFRSLVYLVDDCYFQFYCISWFLIRFTRISGHPIPVLNNWLTDFVFVPLIIHVAQSVSLCILSTSKPYRYPLFQILLIPVLTAYIFEYIMPRATDHHTADVWDIVCYFAGSFFYRYIHQRYSIKKYSQV